MGNMDGLVAAVLFPPLAIALLAIYIARLSNAVAEVRRIGYLCIGLFVGGFIAALTLRLPGDISIVAINGIPLLIETWAIFLFRRNKKAVWLSLIICALQSAFLAVYICYGR